MSMSHEPGFAEVAQEEAVISRSQSREETHSTVSKKDRVRSETRETEDSSSETSLLLSGQDRPQANARSGKSPDEPWSGGSKFDHLPWYKRPSILWLLPGFFPFCVAFGALIVPKTYLILDLICKDYLSDRAALDPTFRYMPILIGDENPQCRIAEVQSLVSYFNTYQDLLAGLFSAVMTPILGALSDRVGRKKIIVISSFGALATEIITIIVGRNPDTVSVYWILLGSLIDGISGSFTTGLALSFAYAADCTSPETRSVAFGYFHGTFFTGIALGPIVAGWLIRLSGSVMIVFYVALGCHLFFIVFTTLFVPESLTKERQMLAREKHATFMAQLADNTWVQTIKKFNILEPLWVLRPHGPGSSPTLRRNLFVLAAVDTMMFGVAMGTMRIILIYAEYKFGWSPVASSQFLSVVNIVRVSVLVFGLPLLTRLFRGKQTGDPTAHRGSDMLDINIIRGVIIFDLAGYLGYAFAPVGAVMVASGVVAAFGGIGSPTLQSALTKHIPPDKTGQVLGASGLLHALARIVAPIVFNIIYAKTVKMFAGFVFLCLGFIFVIVFVLSWFLKPNVYLHDEDDTSVGDEQQSDGVDMTRE